MSPKDADLRDVSEDELKRALDVFIALVNEPLKELPRSPSADLCRIARIVEDGHTRKLCGILGFDLSVQLDALHERISDVERRRADIDESRKVFTEKALEAVAMFKDRLSNGGNTLRNDHMTELTALESYLADNSITERFLETHFYSRAQLQEFQRHMVHLTTAFAISAQTFGLLKGLDSTETVQQRVDNIFKALNALDDVQEKNAFNGIISKFENSVDKNRERDFAANEFHLDEYSTSTTEYHFLAWHANALLSESFSIKPADTFSAKMHTYKNMNIMIFKIDDSEYDRPSCNNRDEIDLILKRSANSLVAVDSIEKLMNKAADGKTVPFKAVFYAETEDQYIYKHRILPRRQTTKQRGDELTSSFSAQTALEDYGHENALDYGEPCKRSNTDFCVGERKRSQPLLY